MTKPDCSGLRCLFFFCRNDFFLNFCCWLVIFRCSVNRQGRGISHFRNSFSIILAGILISFAILTKWLALVFLPCLLLTVGSASRRYFIFGCLVNSKTIATSSTPARNPWEKFPLMMSGKELENLVFTDICFSKKNPFPRYNGRIFFFRARLTLIRFI
jgi:hypothetical protein